VAAKGPNQGLDLHSEDDDRSVSLPLFEENIQKPPHIVTIDIRKSVPKPKHKTSLRLLDTQVHTTVDTTIAPAPEQLLHLHCPLKNPKKRSSSLAMLGGIQIGLPGSRHSRHSKEVMLASIEASPTTPTQAMTRIGSTNSMVTAMSTSLLPASSSSSSSSSSSITPTTTLPNTTFPSLPSPTFTKPTTIANQTIDVSATAANKPRVRALTATSVITSSPQLQPLSFVSAYGPREPQVKSRAKPIVSLHHSTSNPSLNPRQRQNSTSNRNNVTQGPMITSPRNSPPPDFLLDDDPFANLTGGAVGVGFGSGGGKVKATGSRLGDVKPPPRSPLINDGERELDEGLVIGTRSCSCVPEFYIC